MKEDHRASSDPMREKAGLETDKDRDRGGKDQNRWVQGLGAGDLSEVSPMGRTGRRQLGPLTRRTWATRRFSPNLSCARLSLRALSLDKESRREASSVLSFVMESSSSTRPASA